MQGTARSYIDDSEQARVDCPSDRERAKTSTGTATKETLTAACLHAWSNSRVALLNNLDLNNYPQCAGHVITVGTGVCREHK